MLKENRGIKTRVQITQERQLDHKLCVSKNVKEATELQKNELSLMDSARLFGFWKELFCASMSL